MPKPTVLQRLRVVGVVLLHKAHVFRAGLVTGVPIRRLLQHDLSKFSDREWPTYHLWVLGMSTPEADAAAFARHCETNDHHWEHWGGREMSDVAVREMAADMMAASYAKTGSWRAAVGWFLDHAGSMTLHPASRRKAEAVLSDAFGKFEK
jgi:hypothetical protein